MRTCCAPLGGLLRCVLPAALLAAASCTPAAAQARALMPIEFQHSLEYRWLGKPVLAARSLDDMADPLRTWRFSGTGRMSALTIADSVLHGTRALRVDVNMYVDSPAPTRTRLSSVNLNRPFAGEDWSGYNRISLWIRPLVSGFPMLPLQLVLHSEGRDTIPDRYGREGIHYITLRNNVWQQVVWEIGPLPRDRVTALEIGYWVNKLLADRTDRIAFEIARLELQRVEPDHVEGWQVAPGRIAFSHSGYALDAPKSALATGLAASEFRVIRVDSAFQGDVVHTGPVQSVRTRLGDFQVLDFSALRAPGRYALQAGGVRTQPFLLADHPWRSSVEKSLNFFFGERCGHVVPESHGICHADWTATRDSQRIAMNGGWHDAGDLSQATVNTAEATYAMFALAERLRESAAPQDARLLRLALDEARWGLEWLLRVRFPGGYRIHFASNNLWTNGIIGDADDRTRAARNNPTTNYAAAMAEALAYRVLRDSDPDLAARSLRIAEDDWKYAIAGREAADTRDTPAFASTEMELAAMGTLASIELFGATGDARYSAKAKELAATIIASQQLAFVGREFPLSGFFYTGPARDTIFHQFHRGNDQAPIVALIRLAEALPADPDWMKWYAAVARYAEYQKRSVAATSPYEVLPAYVYRDDEHLQQPDSVFLHQGTRAAFRAQVLKGMPMGDGWYLRAFPVWFARRGNYGVLLSQAKALSAAARFRRDPAALRLAERQLQWVVGRNPFTQSTMYGEGYDWSQQYSVSSGDFVGALPVGMQSRGIDDAPYYPAANMYVYKEVWVHPVARWLWIVPDLMPRAASGDDFQVGAETDASGNVTLRVEARAGAARSFTVRSENVRLRASDGSRSWRGRIERADEPWVAVVIADGDVQQRREVIGWLPHHAASRPPVR